MKIKLIRCFICQDWYSPSRPHCPNCGATPIAVGPTTIHVDAACEYKPGILMGSAIRRYRFVQFEGTRLSLMQIARELSQ